jgi:hypothetical protein
MSFAADADFTASSSACINRDPSQNSFKRLIKNAAQLAKVEVDSVAKKQTLPDKAIAHLVWDLVRWAGKKHAQFIIITLLSYVINMQAHTLCMHV